MDGMGLEEALIRHLHRDKVMPTGMFARHVRDIDEQLEKSRRLRERLGGVGVRRRVLAMYERYRPDMVDEAGSMLGAYYGREKVLLDELVREYGEEPGGDGNGPSSPLKYVNRRRAGTMRRRDCYGFLTPDDIAEPRFDVEKMQRYLEQPRQGGDLREDSEFLDILVATGLDDVSRSQLWLEIARYEAETKPVGDFSPDYDVRLEAPEGSVVAVDKDLDRTFPDCNQFDKGEVTRDELHRVLLAYSAHNEAGYCQGLNFITGILLLFLEEAAAFSVLNLVTNTGYYNGGYYGREMEMCTVDQGVLEDAVKAEVPGVVERLTELNLTLTDLCVKWFLCLFVDSFPTATMLVLWDFYLLFGIRFTFAFTLAFFSTHSDFFTTSPDLTTTMVTCKHLASRLTSPKEILALALSRYLPMFTEERLQVDRKRVRERMVKEKEEKELLRQKLRRQREEREAAAASPEKKTSSSSPRSRLKGMINFRKKS